MKFGIWLLIAVAVVLWLNHAKRQRLKQRAAPPAKAPPVATGAKAEQVIACAHCGLHVPLSDAVLTLDGSAVYCSEAHRRLHSSA
ncbi:MAG: hypothetical protein H7327_05265 [Herminiimonas sp.]|nr:hypothetical protein [Herminiimonas sp.]